MAISPDNIWRLCYCRCCCLGAEAGVSDEKDGYNRRMDCSCKRRWPWCPENEITVADHLRMLEVRALDLGRKPTADSVAQYARKLRRQLAAIMQALS